MPPEAPAAPPPAAPINAMPERAVLTNTTPLRDAAIKRHFPGRQAATPPPPAPAAPAPEKAAAPPAADTAAPPAETPPPAATPGEQPSPPNPAETAAKPEIKPVKETPWQRAHRYEKLANQLQAELETLRKAPKTADPELTKSYETLKAEHDKVLDELKFSAYEKHPDFQTNYLKPFNDAWNAGRKTVSAMSVVDAGKGETRKGTPEDFDNLMMLRSTDPDAAARTLVDMFGPKAFSIEARMVQVEEKQATMAQAREDYKTKGIARTKEQEAQAAGQRKAVQDEVVTQYRQHYEAVPKEHPELFSPVEGDVQGNEDLKIGYEQAQKAFANLNPFDPSLTPEQRKETIRLHAETIHFAAISRRLIRWHRTAQAKIKTLEGKLSQFDQSVPRSGAAGPSPNQPLTSAQSFEKNLRKRAR